MWILIRYLASRAGFYSPWWEYQHMAIRHNSRPQSGYLFSAQHYFTNNYSVYSIKPCNLHKWPQHLGLKHYSTFTNLFSWIKRHTRCFDAEGAQRTRWQKAEISLSLNYFIPLTARQRKTDLLPARQMHTIIQGERTWCFPCWSRKIVFTR